MPSRRDGIPTVVGSDGQVERLERLPLGERDISEGWLQQRLFDCPDLLPIDEIDPGFGPLVPIGMEVDTPAGPIDNLYVSPQGLLTLVEAKLWRNPQARREVVGQILDYAKEVSRWSYEDLDAKAKAVSEKSLWELASAGGTSLDETRFVDAVARNLGAGRFLLLIVGDGIREEMELLAEFLQGTPQLRFTLALVELQLYRLGSDGRLLVMPMVVGRTTEVTRAVVRVVSAEGAKVDVSIDIAPDDGGTEKKRKKLTYDEFFQELANNDVSPDATETARKLHDAFSADKRFVIDWKITEFAVKLKDPYEGRCLYSLLHVTFAGTAAMWSLAGQLSRMGLPDELAFEYVRKIGELVGATPVPRWPDAWIRPAPLEAVGAHYAECVSLIHRLAEEIYAKRTAAESPNP